ncbi:MAG TPA: L,D-transpeptidase family protein, partial [Geomonas sp.]
MNSHWRFILDLGALLAVFCSAGCAVHGELPQRISDNLDSIAAAAAASDQLVYVDPGPASQAQATVYALQRTVFGWQPALAPVRANIGRNGIAPPWEKREGDGRTPSGLFPLRQAFGYPAALKSRLPYRQVSFQDLWVDDAQSPDYNRWARRGETEAGSFEELMRSDPLYRYALVLEYNSAPVVRDLGSAIFMHVERAQASPTSGCISLPEEALLQVAQWLDPADNPQVLIGTTAAVQTLASGISSRIPADLPPEMRLRLQGAARLLTVRQGKPGGYFAAAVSLPPAVERLMLAKKSWRPGCPV